MVDLLSVTLSRLQFAFTIGYHFIFVPITLGLTLIIAIMETIYVKTGNPIYKDMVKFWGMLFGLQFAMGVATGVPMEFQFGTNWSYYSHYVGDIFGAPLAIEGLMAFFLEATFIGVFFFGWDRLTKVQHCVVTWLVFLGSNLSGLWILVANGWMQHPVGAVFNPDTMRMELTSFTEMFFNPLVQNRFMHTLSAGYITGAVLVIAVSSMYLLARKNYEFAKKSIQVAAIVGMVSIIMSIFAGDNQGVMMTEKQPAKLAAIEAIWETEPAPASFNLLAIPLQSEQRNALAIQIPWVLGLIDTHSFNTVIPGIKDVIKTNEVRIKDGLIAYKALSEYKEDNTNKQARAILEKHSNNLGYALLLKRYRSDILHSTPEQIKQAAKDTVPYVLPLFLSFRLMVGIGAFLLLYFAVLNFAVIKGWAYDKKWILIWSVIMLPLPWIAIYTGWFVAEYGRQPWVIQDILPTFLAASSLPPATVTLSLIGFLLIYTVLFIINIYLTVHFLKKGPTETVKNTY